jgi:cell shape-determining protein MreC
MNPDQLVTYFKKEVEEWKERYTKLELKYDEKEKQIASLTEENKELRETLSTPTRNSKQEQKKTYVSKYNHT